MLQGRLIGAAALLILPRVAAAQFTSYVQPQCKVIDSVRVVVAAARNAKAEAAARIRLTAMKEWVDSVAGLPSMSKPANEAVEKRKPTTRPSTPAQPNVGEPIPPKPSERESTPSRPNVGEPIPPTPSAPTAPAPRPRETTSPGEVAPPIPAPPIPAPPIPAPPIPPPPEMDTFVNGARAPETASTLPLFAAAGTMGIVAGVALLSASGRA